MKRRNRDNSNKICDDVISILTLLTETIFASYDLISDITSTRKDKKNGTKEKERK